MLNRNASIGDANCARLASALADNDTIWAFSVAGCNAGDSTMQALANVLEKNDTLSQISINGCSNITLAGIECIVKVLDQGRGKGLNQFYMKHCDFPAEADVMLR